MNSRPFPSFLRTVGQRQFSPPEQGRGYEDDQYQSEQGAPSRRGQNPRSRHQRGSPRPSPHEPQQLTPSERREIPLDEYPGTKPNTFPSAGAYAGIRNMVQDWNKLQGYTNNGDSIIQTRRRIDARYISIQNSGGKHIGVAIDVVFANPETMTPMFIIPPGQEIGLGVNMPGETFQYIHIIDPKTGKVIGRNQGIITSANMFVLRNGDKFWYTDTFRSPTLRA